GNGLWRSGVRLAAGELCRGDHATFHKQRFADIQPVLEITQPQVVDGPNQIDLVPVRVDIPLARGPQHLLNSVHPAFPRRMKDRRVLLMLDRTHVLHAAQVMDAVHGVSPGRAARATPIMESRVTSVASSSSFRCSVPGGRSGSTI